MRFVKNALVLSVLLLAGLSANAEGSSDSGQSTASAPPPPSISSAPPPPIPGGTTPPPSVATAPPSPAPQAIVQVPNPPVPAVQPATIQSVNNPATTPTVTNPSPPTPVITPVPQAQNAQTPAPQITPQTAPAKATPPTTLTPPPATNTAPKAAVPEKPKTVVPPPPNKPKVTPKPEKKIEAPKEKKEPPKPVETKVDEPTPKPKHHNKIQKHEDPDKNPEDPVEVDDGTLVDSQGDAKNLQNLKPYMDDRLIVLGTGNINAQYYAAGSTMCRLINHDRKKLDMRCAVEATEGSIDNLKKLDKNDLDIAIVQSDWQERSYYGLDMFADNRLDKLRYLFSLHDETLTVIVKQSSGIKTIKDLSNKIISIAPNGSGTRATWNEVLNIEGLNDSSFKRYADVRPAIQAMQLCEGAVDALVLSTGHPNTIVDEAANMCEIKILELNGKKIAELIKSKPVFTEAIIPGGTYLNIPESVISFAVKATVVSTTDTSEDLIYKFTKQIFENIDTIKLASPLFEDFNPDDMFDGGRTAPYHPGALKYFKEVELIVDEDPKDKKKGDDKIAKQKAKYKSPTDNKSTADTFLNKILNLGGSLTAPTSTTQTTDTPTPEDNAANTEDSAAQNSESSNTNYNSKADKKNTQTVFVPSSSGPKPIEVPIENHNSNSSPSNDGQVPAAPPPIIPPHQ